MSFLNYRCVKVQVGQGSLGGHEMFVNSVSVTTENSLQPNYVVNSRHPVSYFPTDGIKGSLSLSYPLTGYDPLREFITNEQTPIRVKIFGWGNDTDNMVVSGYLSSYNLSLKPNSPISVNADVVFFQELSGHITNSNGAALQSPYVLSTSDVSVDVLNGYSTETIDNVQSIDYSFSSEITPQYVIETGVLPNNSSRPFNLKSYKVNFGQKRISANVICDNLQALRDNTIPITGKNMGVKINFKHPTYSAFSDSFTCSGILTSKNFRTSVNDLIYTSLSIVQHNVDSAPSISGFDPLIGSPGSFIKVSGLNLTNISSIYFHDREALRYTVLSDILVSGIVPYDALTGKIVIDTYGGKATSSTNYNLTYPAMAVNYVSPYTGFSGQGCYISGNNFYRISNVFFGDRSGGFRSINSGTIYGYIPGLAPSGLIRVVSTGRGIYANSIHGYVPMPLVTGYTPWTGASGSFFTLSGFGFNGTSAVRFNNINAKAFAVVNDLQITGFVPSGNIKGYISIHGTSGVIGRINYKFNPAIPITGIDPTSGSAGDFCRISGYNFQSGIMYQQSDNNFRVKIGNQVTGFGFESFRSITGRLPGNFIAGPVRIYQADGSMFAETGYMGLTNQPPTITTFNPNLAISGQQYYGYVEGVNLFNVTGLQFVGTDATWNMGRTYIVPMLNNIGERVLRSDSLGLRLNIVNYTGFVFPTGVADVPAEATGKFQLNLYTSQYSTSFASSTPLTIKKIANL